MASQPINLSNAQLDQLQAEFAEQGYVVLPNVCLLYTSDAADE